MNVGLDAALICAKVRSQRLVGTQLIKSRRRIRDVHTEEWRLPCLPSNHLRRRVSPASHCHAVTLTVSKRRERFLSHSTLKRPRCSFRSELPRVREKDRTRFKDTWIEMRSQEMGWELGNGAIVLS